MIMCDGCGWTLKSTADEAIRQHGVISRDKDGSRFERLFTLDLCEPCMKDLEDAIRQAMSTWLLGIGDRGMSREEGIPPWDVLSKGEG